MNPLFESCPQPEKQNSGNPLPTSTTHTNHASDTLGLVSVESCNQNQCKLKSANITRETIVSIRDIEFDGWRCDTDK